MSSLSTTDRLKDLLPQLFNKQKRDGNYYLRFQMTNDINLLLDLGYVQESLTIDSEQITSIPNLPGYVLGMMNNQNQVFLALDLAHLVGFSPEIINQRQYQTIVVQIGSNKNNIQSEESNFYGLMVKRIQGISRILPERFDSSAESAPEILRPFVQGSIQENRSSSEAENIDSPKLQSSFLIDLSRLISTQIKN